MTVAPDRTPLEFQSIDDVVAALREAGHRVSAPARAVLGELFAADGPISAEAIARGAEARHGRLEPTSVYRNLERLEQLGVVRHIHVGHGPGVYGLLSHGEREYLVCEVCGKVTPADAEQLDRVRAVIREQFGYEVRFTHFPIHGRCADCARS